jgi:hypothetical protein
MYSEAVDLKYYCIKELYGGGGADRETREREIDALTTAH